MLTHACNFHPYPVRRWTRSSTQLGAGAVAGAGAAVGAGAGVLLPSRPRLLPSRPRLLPLMTATCMT